MQPLVPPPPHFSHPSSPPRSRDQETDLSSRLLVPQTPRRYRVPIAGLLEHLSLINCFDADSVAFMTKVITSSGMGNETYFPPSLHYIPPSATHLDAMREVHMLLFPTLDDLFAKTRVRPLDVDALVINCSGFAPRLRCRPSSSTATACGTTSGPSTSPAWGAPRESSAWTWPELCSAI
uniref:FAE domain-containing protein n=1 Tax=Ananas comosus var. bracteatus TaxID=296719 RepID=A0A6V7NT43_ANACO|nr:unnamed protein product [Ananas comosus var. bracteatus]